MFLNPFFGNLSQPPSSTSNHSPNQILEVGKGDTSSHVSNNFQSKQSPAQSPRILPKFATTAKNEESLAQDDTAEVLNEIQSRLRPGWTVHATTDGRFYYCNHISQTSGWLPPSDFWEDSGGLNLPYGWEAAVDEERKTYYINHLNKTTTYEDPRKWVSIDPEDIPEPRIVELTRDPELGFGFVAGSEKPVIVRFVTTGGPSISKLKPGDQILQINGEDVKLAPRDHVIQLVRNCRENVTLVVCQPPLDSSSTRKSALLSAAKKAKLKSNPSRVRFAESVDINGSHVHNGLTHSQMTSADSVVPLMPNVLKVFLENGQTKSFKYDSSTTVQDVIDSLQLKLGLGSTKHFALVVEHVKSLRRNKLTLLDPKDTLSKIASRPGAHNLRCLFRITFVPTDPYELLRSDSMAFEYLYVQCCNDVVQERFAPELKHDVALRLAALQIHQHAVSTAGPTAKVNLKAIEKETGLERFLPSSLADSMKRKELKKLLGHFLKLNANLTAPGQKSLTALQAKLHYLKIIGELPSYGAKCFSTTLSDSMAETVILISPKFGVSQINSLKKSVPQNLCDLEQITSIEVTKEDAVSQKIYVHVKDDEKEDIILTLEDRDAEELILVLCGYYKLAAEHDLEVIQDTKIMQQQLDEQDQQQASAAPAPNYFGHHHMTSQGWNYPPPTGEETMEREFTADFSSQLPYHPAPEVFRIFHASDSSSDADSSMTSNSTAEDRNNSIEQKNHNMPNNSKSKSSRVTINLNNNISKSSLEAAATNPQLLSQKNEDDNEYDSDGSPQPIPRNFQANIDLLESQRHAEMKSRLKPSDSSFGLHSPDNFPFGFNLENDQVQDLLNKLKTAQEFDEDILVLDPDLIDLTIIPPPLTPDDDGIYRAFQGVPGAVSSPPTPFTDRESLEAELRFLEKDFGKRQQSRAANLSQLQDAMSDGVVINSTYNFGLPDQENGSSLAAMYELRDIDSFIANVTVPPPPKSYQNYADAEDDILAFIIPPPPASIDSGTKVKLNPAVDRDVSEISFREDAKQVISSSKPSAQLDKISPKIASIQQKLLTSPTSHEAEEDKATFKALQDTLTRKKSLGYVDTLRSSEVPPPPPPPRSSVPKGMVKKATYEFGGQKPPAPFRPSKLPLNPPTTSSIMIAGLAKPLAEKNGFHVDEEELPPSLPPRQSQSPTKKAEDSSSLSNKPVIPSRAKKPLQSSPVIEDNKPINSNSRALPQVPLWKAPPPPPPTIAPPIIAPPELPVKKIMEKIEDEAKPKLPQKMSSSSSPGGRKLPVPPPKPPAALKNDQPGNNNKLISIAKKQLEVYTNSQFDHDLEDNSDESDSDLPSSIKLVLGVPIGESNDDDSDEKLKKASRSAVFSKAEEALRRVLSNIDQAQGICSGSAEAGTIKLKESYGKAKEALTNESRQFVTASKLFVKSATESEGQLLECLSHCVHMIDRIGRLTIDVSTHTPTPMQTQALISKVRDVADTFLQTVLAAGNAVGQDMNDPSMNVLMKKATNLASVLTTLMRSLRVFN